MGISSEGALLKGARWGRLTIAHRPRRCQITWRTILGPLFVGTALLVTAPAAAQERTKPEADAVALAQRTLAAKLSVAPERIDVVRISPVQWRDSSLGCPERGMAYTPALVSGYEVRLRNADREHVVHVAGTRAVICGSQPDSKRPPDAMIAGSLKAADAVRTAVAARLGIEPAQVRIISTRPFRPSAPCPAAPAPPKSGALIVEAQAAEQTFRFYTDDSQILNCDK
jgi:hypothetical protein